MRRNRLLYASTILACLFSYLTACSQSDDRSLRLMTYNIQHGAGMDDVVDLDRQAAVIRDAMPDVVGLQEVDSVVKRSGYKNQAALFGQKLGMHATFGPAIPLTRGKYGVAILSKEAPLSVRNIPLPGAEKRTLLVCEFQDYVFATTHLDLEEENRLASLPIIIEEADHWDKPFFICGDWNDKPSSTLISRIKRGFRILNYITDNSANYTFPASVPTSIIDYIASYSKAVKSVKSREVVNAPDASDHRPVVVEVTFNEDYITGVAAPSAVAGEARAKECFDLSGHRMRNAAPRGIYIRNGKKVAAERGIGIRD